MVNQITETDVANFAEAVGDPHSVGNNTLDLYQKVATLSAIYPGQGSSLGLAYAALKLNGEAGELAEHVGKAMRDDNYVPSGITDDGEHLADLGASLTDERKALIVKEVGDVLWYLSAICNELGIKLSDAANANLVKLQDRTARNKLQGMGDER